MKILTNATLCLNNSIVNARLTYLDPPSAERIIDALFWGCVRFVLIWAILFLFISGTAWAEYEKCVSPDIGASTACLICDMCEKERMNR